MSNNKTKFFKNASNYDIHKYFKKLGKIALLKGGKYNDIYINDIKLLNKFRQKGGFIGQLVEGAKGAKNTVIKKASDGAKCSFGIIGQGKEKAEKNWANLKIFLKKHEGFSRDGNTGEHKTAANNTLSNDHNMNSELGNGSGNGN